MLRWLPLSNFGGGLSDDQKYGPQNSFSVGRQIDIRKGPGIIGLTPGLTKESGSTITTEVHDMIHTDDDNVYMAGETKIYKRTPGSGGTAGTYSVESSDASLSGVRDLIYHTPFDKLFAIDEDEIHELSNVTGTSSWDYSKYTSYVGQSQNDGETSNSYTLPSSISETATDKFGWTVENEPIVNVIFNVDTVGTGDWTVTLHDGGNNIVGQKTISNGSLPTAGNDVTFTFDSRLRANFGSGYHVHLTSSTGDGAVHTATSADLSTVDVDISAGRLVGTGEYGHYATQFGPFIYICNGRYLAEWEVLDTSDNATAGFESHKLVLPAECVTIGTAVYNESLAVACGIKSSTDDENAQLTEGVIFFYNGAGDAYQYSLEVPQGAPYGIHAKDNVLYFIANGRQYQWAGGDIEMVYEFPGVSNFEADGSGPSTEVYLRAPRRAMTTRDNIVKMGFPYATANTNTEIGVFGWGKGKGFMPNANSYDHLISTGSQFTNFDSGSPITGITCVKNMGNNLLVAWKDVVGGSVTYGVDYLNDTSDAATSGRWVSLLFDNNRAYKKKTARSVVVTSKTLPTGCTVTPIIEYERSGTFVNTSGADGQITAGGTFAKLDVHKRYRELRFGVDITSSSGEYPEVVSVTLKYDDNEEDEDETE